MLQSTPHQRTTEQIRVARGDVVQGDSDNYFPTMCTDRQNTGGSSSLYSSDILEDARNPIESTTVESESLVNSLSSVYTPRQYHHPARLVVRGESIESHELLRTPPGSQTPTAPGGHPKPILKQSLASLLAEKRSSLHDILSTSPDLEPQRPRRVSFADEDELATPVVSGQNENTAPSISECEDSTTTEQRLRGIARMLLFELERRLKVNTPTPDSSRNPLSRLASSTSVNEPEPPVDFVQVVPWDESRVHHSGRGPSGSDSWNRIKSQVFSWCNEHGDGSYNGGPKQMVELRTLPIELQDLILEIERGRIEQTQGHGKRKHRIVYLDVSQILNPS